MNAEKLLYALGDIGDDLIGQAEDRRPARRTALKWTAAAAGLLLAAGLGIWGVRLLPFFGGATAGAGGAGHGGEGAESSSSVFMSYGGPVFPLDVLEETPGLSASRELLYDFSPWDPVWVSNEQQLAERNDLTPEERREYEEDLQRWFPEGGYEQTSTDLLVTDRYTLENSSGQEAAVTAVYPFTGSFQNLSELTPEILTNGRGAGAELLAGGYSSGFAGAVGGEEDSEERLNLQNLDSWVGYWNLLKSGEYREDALREKDFGQLPVTVYKFDAWSAPHEEYPAATQAISFTVDAEKTRVLTYGFEGLEWDSDTGFQRHSYFVPDGMRRSTETKLLAVVGEDIGQYALQGYQNGGCEAGEEIDGVSCTVTRYESTLRELLESLTEEYLREYTDDSRGKIVEQQRIFDLYVNAEEELLRRYGLLSENGAERYDTGRLEDVISETGSQQRVFYQAFKVTVPAGGSTEVAARMTKYASYDFYCSGSENRGIYGYDMVTQLGSGLAFGQIEAQLLHTEQLEIVRQNYGFDLGSGITRVSIDPAQQHCYLEVRRAQRGD
ncbi:MAG: hypothetical protein SOX72_01840 [Oscillospiraceae bacterium]|nr:hypothetical protein [Oscillospiraceae bacterium]